LKVLVIRAVLEEQASPNSSIEDVVDIPSWHLTSPTSHHRDDGKADADPDCRTKGSDPAIPGV
jgi:hypothetical protein